MLTLPSGPLNLNPTQLLLRLQHIHEECTTTCALTLTGDSIPDCDYNALEQVSQLSVILKKVYKESLLWVYIGSGQQTLVQLSKKLHTVMRLKRVTLTSLSELI